MQSRALVVKMYGDRQIGNAIADGMRLNSSQLAVVSLEMKAQRARDARIGVMQARVAKDWTEEIAKAREAYRSFSEPLRASKLLIGWAMLWYGIDMAYRRLAAMNRS